MDGVFITELAAGPGIRLAVKDLFDTAGVRTTYGSAIFAEHVPDRTAEAVARLQAAGYRTIGKANLHEFAWGITSENEHYGWVPNPVAPGRIAGGSSGGSAAALAAGLADAALGTDSGGSVRIPAACCGNVGFKPTHGLVSLEGCFALAPSYDHAGPMARDVQTCELMLDAMADAFTPVAPIDPGELTVGLAWTEHADPLVRDRVESAAARFGNVRRIDVPFPDGSYALFMREAAEVHAGLWRDHRDAYGDNVAVKVRRAMDTQDADVARAERARAEYRQRMDEVMEGIDLLITPTLAVVAPPSGVGDLVLREQLLRFTYPFNVTGAPALALPCGTAELGLPASVQLAGRPGADALVLAAGNGLYL